MSPRPRRLALAAVSLAGMAGAVIALAQPDGARDRRRAVGDWLVEDVAEDDGGRIVRMTRTADDYSLEYHASFWRGNSAPARGASAQRLNCMRGGEEGGDDRARDPRAPELRARLAGYLAECEIPPGEVDAALEGFERAFALASVWAREAAAATAAEAAAIADYGAEANINMSMDANLGRAIDDTTPANSTGPRPD